ncbi:MAG: hypothetical protein IT238_06235 [Bacteroidia bacterium]|nr:hypothetical protein [Bacteroidia bacterium]MCZ2249869.1 hypothetical protein [Bacteroidia bacterium]
MKNNFFILLIFTLLAVYSQAQEPFKVYGKFMVNGGSVKGAKIAIEKNGVQVNVSERDNNKFEFALEYDCEYVFSFMKEGYITKKILVSCKVPKEKQTLEFEPFKFDVEIFKQYPGVNTVIYNQPVGKIKFNDVLNEFDYDTDYTKSIQNEIKKVEDALKQKAKEEAEKKPEPVVKQEPVKTPEKSAPGVDLSKALGEGPKPKTQQTGTTATKTTSMPMPTKTVTLTGIVTMGSYTAAEYNNPNMRSYGWINYGDNNGRVEIATREEYEAKFRQYMEK